MLAIANGGKYKVERRWPDPEWVGPFIEINEQYIEQADVTKPVLFATIMLISIFRDLAKRKAQKSGEQKKEGEN